MANKDNKQQIREIENINELNDKRLTAEKQLFNALKKNSKELESSDKKHIKAMETITKSQRGFKQLLGETKDLIKDTVGIFVSWNFAQDVLNAAKGVVAMEKSLYRASINAGKTAEEGKKVVGIAAEMRMELGATADDAEKVLKTFVKGQYKGNIKEAAESSYQFARAMDISQETVAKNTLELQKWGQIGPKAATAMYTDIMKIAQGYGLTSEGAEGVIKTTTKLSGYMRAFGKNETEIQKMNLGFAKMVSSMEKVGVAAQDALAMVEQLLDPERIEENIPAYAALGISITDAINGNIDPEQITSGMKEVGNKLKEMGPIAGAAYAKAMGISYKNAIKSADLEQITEEAMTPQETAAEQMKQLTENTKNLTEKVNDFINKIQGMIQSFGPLLMVVIGGVIPRMFVGLGKKLFSNFKENTKKGMTEGSEEGAVKIRKNLVQELKEIQKKAKLEIKAEIEPESVSKAMKDEEKINKKLEKKLSRIVLTTSGRSAAKQKLGETKQNLGDLIGQKKDLETSNKITSKALAAIENEIQKLQSQENLNAKEARNLLKLQNEKNTAVEALNKKSIKIEELNKEIAKLEKVQKPLEKVLNDTEGKELKKTRKEKASEKIIAKKSKKFNKEESKASNELTKSTEQLTNINKESTKASNELTKSTEQLTNINKESTKATEQLSSAVSKNADKKAKGEISSKKIGKVEKKAKGEISSKKIGKVEKKAKGSGGKIKGLGKLVGGIGILGGGISLLVGLLMKMEPVQKAVQKIMEKASIWLNKLGKILQPLIDDVTEFASDLLDALMPLVEVLISVISPILRAILWPFKKLAEWFSKWTKSNNNNTEAVEKNTEAMETKPAQIKRNEDGTLSSTTATIKSSENNGASSQNTATEIRTVTVTDNELKSKIDIISKYIFDFKAVVEKFLSYNFMIEQRKLEKEDDNLKKQSMVLEKSIKNGIKDNLRVDVNIATKNKFSIVEQ